MISKDKFLPFDMGPGVTCEKTPRRKKEEFQFSIGKSSLGLILVALSEFGIVSILRGRDRQEMIDRLQSRFRQISLREDRKAVKTVLAEVIRFIEKPRSHFDLPLNIRGTLFQQKVWHEVKKVPLGKTSTYAKIAEAIRKPRAMRAVGSACTNNHFFMIIPCHRILHTGETAGSTSSKASTGQQMLIARESRKPSRSRA